MSPGENARSVLLDARDDARLADATIDELFLLASSAAVAISLRLGTTPRTVLETMWKSNKDDEWWNALRDQYWGDEMSDEDDGEHWHIAMCVDDDHIFTSPAFDADTFEDAFAQGRTMFAAYVARAEQEGGGRSLKKSVRCIGLWRCGFLFDEADRTIEDLL